MKKLKADRLFLKRQTERRFKHEIERKRKRKLVRLENLQKKKAQAEAQKK